jgi:hypothetical protein
MREINTKEERDTKTEKCKEMDLQAVLVLHQVLACLTVRPVPYHLVCQRYLEAPLFLVHPQVLALQEVLEVQEVLRHLEALGAPHFQTCLVVQCHPATGLSLTVECSAHVSEVQIKSSSGEFKKAHIFWELLAIKKAGSWCFMEFLTHMVYEKLCSAGTGFVCFYCFAL